MKTDWDYTQLADAYLKRPSYSKESIESMLEVANVSRWDKVCDIGAGTAHLTLILAEHGLEITAIEPNDAMRRNGIERTKSFSNIRWVEAIAENTKQSSSHFNLVTFGSSFNVIDRKLALEEAYRVLKPSSWFVCMWNHRDLNDPIQAGIENIIKSLVADYSYGTRRDDQTEIIRSSGLFSDVKKIESMIYYEQKVSDCIEAWRSHNTLCRQAGNRFNEIMKEIENYLNNVCNGFVRIPYITRIWMARSIKDRN